MIASKVLVRDGDPYYLVATTPLRETARWQKLTLTFVRVRRSDRAAGRAIALWLLAKAVMSS